MLKLINFTFGKGRYQGGMVHRVFFRERVSGKMITLRLFTKMKEGKNDVIFSLFSLNKQLCYIFIYYLLCFSNRRPCCPFGI